MLKLKRYQDPVLILANNSYFALSVSKEFLILLVLRVLLQDLVYTHGLDQDLVYTHGLDQDLVYIQYNSMSSTQ